MKSNLVFPIVEIFLCSLESKGVQWTFGVKENAKAPAFTSVSQLNIEEGMEDVRIDEKNTPKKVDEASY